jgi:type VI secretion system protein ImpC
MNLRRAVLAVELPSDPGIWAISVNEWKMAFVDFFQGGTPTHAFQTDDGDIRWRSPTDLAITERREVELSRLGFIPLCHYKDTDMAVFFAVPSVQQPKQYLDEHANANARLVGQIQYLMAVSRFAHFMMAVMRDKIGSFMSRDACETLLNHWIAKYVLLDDTAIPEAKAQFPLRAAA